MSISIYIDTVYLTQEERDDILMRESEYLFEQIDLAREDRNVENMFWIERGGRRSLVNLPLPDLSLESEMERIAAREERDRQNNFFPP